MNSFFTAWSISYKNSFSILSLTICMSIAPISFSFLQQICLSLPDYCYFPLVIGQLFHISPVRMDFVLISYKSWTDGFCTWLNSIFPKPQFFHCMVCFLPFPQSKHCYLLFLFIFIVTSNFKWIACFKCFCFLYWFSWWASLYFFPCVTMRYIICFFLRINYNCFIHFSNFS